MTSNPCTVTMHATKHDRRIAADWWPIGQGVGYGSTFANPAADLLEHWPDQPWTPDFAHGAAVQAVCEAMERSATTDRWVNVSEVTG